MRQSLFNGCLGVLATAWTWCVGAMHNIGEVAQFIGVVVGAAAAVLSFLNALQTWRRSRK